MGGLDLNTMNYSLIGLELMVALLGLLVLLVDLWTPGLQAKRNLGYFAAAGLGLVLLASFRYGSADPQFAFNHMYVMDDMALFFKRFFLIATILVLLLAVEFSDVIVTGISEYYAIILFALTGMMFSASANDLSLMFVSVELITVSFYVLTSFQRNKVVSLEAGVKYLIQGGVSSALMVYGIALVYGMSTKLNFADISAAAPGLIGNKLFLLGILLILMGLSFKIASFPIQMWAPDVYQGSPTPSTALLAVGSKAAGFALMLRFLFTAVPAVTQLWVKPFIVISALTILYGNLCAIPQRNLKRLLGYSSISNAGYLMIGIAAMSNSGISAILYYLGGYLFAVLAAFTVICVVMRHLDTADFSGLNGLHHRSPLLATTLTMAMVSLAGIPPLAGFFGKFLLLKSIIEEGPLHRSCYWLTAIALFGVVVSIYYYFGVIKAIYWSKDAPDMSPIPVSLPMRLAVTVCIVGMLVLGLYPDAIQGLADNAAQLVAFAK